MSDRNLFAWAAGVTARLDALGATEHEVHIHRSSTVIKIRRVAVLTGLLGPEAAGAVIPDGPHLVMRVERDAAVLTLYSSGTAMWQGEPGARAWAREIFRGPGPAFVEDAALGAKRVAVP